jgi:hypothetical protein
MSDQDHRSADGADRQEASHTWEDMRDKTIYQPCVATGELYSLEYTQEAERRVPDAQLI